MLGSSTPQGTPIMKSAGRNAFFKVGIASTLSLLSLLLFNPQFVSGKELYYYIHVSSFRVKGTADREVIRLAKNGYAVFTRHEKVPLKGFWYRVYIGPLSSLQDATAKQKELRKKALVTYAAIRKTDFPLTVDPPKTPAGTEKAEREPAKELPDASKFRESPPQTSKKIVRIPPPKKKPLTPTRPV